MTSIFMTEPVSIRGYTSGGRGGYGYSSSPWHRLHERAVRGDLTACGVLFRDSKTVVKNGAPKPSAVEKYGQCAKCWPNPHMTGECGITEAHSDEDHR